MMKTTTLFFFCLLCLIVTIKAQSGEYSGYRVICVACSSGIGRSAAEILLRGGAEVVVSSRRLEVCQQVIDELNAEREGAAVKGLAVAADASSEEQLAALVAASKAFFGEGRPITSVVWAPTALSMALFQRLGAQATVAALQDQMDINVYGLVRLLGHTIDDLVAAAQQGLQAAVVSVSSIASHSPSLGLLPYGTAKAAQDHLITQLALEYGALGVRFNSVRPAAIDTPIFDGPGVDRAQVLRGLAWRHALGRVGHPDEVGEPIAFLLSSQSSFITGQSLIIDGGSRVLSAFADSLVAQFFPDGDIPDRLLPLLKHFSHATTASADVAPSNDDQDIVA